MAAEPASLLIAPESSSPVTPAKRRRSSGCLPSTKFKKPMAIESPPRSPPMDARLGDHNTRSILNENHHMRSEDNHPSITLSASARLAGQTVAPFLAKHIPDQYAPLGGAEGQPEGPPNANNDTKYCYRHRPDSKCRRQADEPSMDQLQSVRRAVFSTGLRALFLMSLTLTSNWRPLHKPINRALPTCGPCSPLLLRNSES